jgi:hypothetical protein
MSRNCDRQVSHHTAMCWTIVTLPSNCARLKLSPDRTSVSAIASRADAATVADGDGVGRDAWVTVPRASGVAGDPLVGVTPVGVPAPHATTTMSAISVGTALTADRLNLSGTLGEIGTSSSLSDYPPADASSALS